MTRSFLLITFIGTAGLIGCESKTVEKKASTVTSEDVRRDVDQARKTTAEYVEQTKDDFQMDLNNRLKAIDSQIASLRAKQSELQSEAKANWERKLIDLEAKRDDISAKLGEVSRASAEAWKDVKQGTLAAWEELDRACREAMNEFKATTTTK